MIWLRMSHITEWVIPLARDVNQNESLRYDALRSHDRMRRIHASDTTHSARLVQASAMTQLRTSTPVSPCSSHITQNESCHRMSHVTEWVMSQNESCHRMSHVTEWVMSQNESCHKMSHVTKWVMSQNESCHRMSHVTEWVTSLIWLSLLMKQSHHAHASVTSGISLISTWTHCSATHWSQRNCTALRRNHV